MATMTLAQLKRAVKIGFVLDDAAQSTHIENAARECLRYGVIASDVQWEEKTGEKAGFHRVRKISYLGYTWRHVMHNGKVTALGWTKA